jgi:hypothetical protein
MLNFYKKLPSLVYIESAVVGLIMISPLFCLLIFLTKHNPIVLSTKTWLLLFFFYLNFLILLLPLVYSLIAEIIHNLKQKKIHPQSETASVSFENQI